MGKVGNVPTAIQEGIRDAFGGKTKIAFARAVNLEVKPDKYDARVLAMNDHRVFVLTPKIPMKLETNLHFLDINLLESKSPTKLVIGTESKRIVLASSSQDENTDEFDRAIGHVIVSLAKVFPSVSTEKLIAKVDFTPPARLQDFRKIGANIGKKDEGPCGNYSTMYRCMCDYHNMEVQEDVAWDVDMIYLSQDSKEMNLRDFDHLDSRHLLPIISALEHNLWFTRLNASNVKLSPEAINEILKILKTNVAIEELVLANINVRAEFCQRLCMSLVGNTGSPLTVLDLSGNIVEDRGLNHLCAPITKLSRGLVELNLSMTGITAKGVNKLAEALLSNKNVPLNLRCLDLSENGFKGEDVSNLFNFFAQPNALTDLRLGTTECALESLFAALQRGCAQNLTNLDVSNNFFSYKKQGRDIAVPPSWKQFFATAISLKSVNFSGTRLPPDALRSVLEGIESNPSLTDVELNLSCNGLGLPGNQGGQVLETSLSSVRNISHLDLSDNGFDVGLASILGKLSQNKSLRKLSIGRNLNNIKPKNAPQVIEAIIQLIHQDYSPIRCLNVDNLRLKTETMLLINALGTNDTLTEIDISGNQMGDTGARMLSKALQLNKTLNVIYWDHNSTSSTGFQDIAVALERNFSLHTMPMPVNDAAQALRLNPEKTEQALKKIESLLQRNHGPRKMPTDQAYRLNQNFESSPLQQDMDAHLIQLQDHIEKFESLRHKYQLSNAHANAQEEVAKAQALVKEAECAKMLLLQLQRIVQESESSSSLQKELNALGSSFCEVVTKQLKANVSAMISCAEKLFPVTLNNEGLQEELMVSSEAKSQLSEEFIQSLIVDHLTADLENKTSESNLLAASHISDRILKEVTNGLEKSIESLKLIVNSARSQLLVSGQLKDEDAESKEHRDNLKRRKLSSATTDEDQDTTTEMPLISDKHKSQLLRRLRPQSAVVEISLNQTDGKNLDGAAAHSSSTDFFPTEDAFVQKLEHLGKDRPKRPKKKPVTRPMAFDPIIDEDDVSCEFFDTKPHHQIEKKQNGELTVSEETEEMIKSDAASKKEKAKAAVLSPKAESKGFASNLKSLFKKKSPEGDTPPLARKSDESSAPEGNQVPQKIEEKPLECGDSINKSSEEINRKEMEEPVESRPKHPSGMAKIGLPGMAVVNLAELRSKRATAKHVPGPNESGKTSTVEVAKEKNIQSTEKKTSQSKENSKLPSTEDNVSGVSSRLSGSGKSRPPPPLAPKPNKRASVIDASVPTTATTTSSPTTTAIPKPAVSITRGLSEAEEETQEPEQKTDVLQAVDPAAPSRKNRMSVREKAANIDKNSNLNSVDGSPANKKSVTLPADISPRSSEILAQQPSSDGSVSLASSSLITSGSECETTILPSDPPADIDNDEDGESQTAEKRQSDVTVIRI